MVVGKWGFVQVTQWFDLVEFKLVGFYCTLCKINWEKMLPVFKLEFCVFPCWIVWCVSDATVICRIPLGLCGQKSYNIKCAKMVPSRKFKHKFCLYLLTGFIHFNSCFPILQGWRFPLNLRRSSYLYICFVFLWVCESFEWGFFTTVTILFLNKFLILFSPDSERFSHVY